MQRRCGATTAGVALAAVTTLTMASALGPARSLHGQRARLPPLRPPRLLRQPGARPAGGRGRALRVGPLAGQADCPPEWRVLPEHEWRARAEAHRARVCALLAPGFLVKRERGDSGGDDGFWGLDGDNPIYNFLLRYYNIRGAAGTRRLARWSPGAHVVLEGGARPLPRAHALLAAAQAAALAPAAAVSSLRYDMPPRCPRSHRCPPSRGAATLEDDAQGDHALLHPKALVPAPDSAGAAGLTYSPSLLLERGNASSFQWYREVLRVTQGAASGACARSFARARARAALAASAGMVLCARAPVFPFWRAMMCACLAVRGRQAMHLS